MADILKNHSLRMIAAQPQERSLLDFLYPSICRFGDLVIVFAPYFAWVNRLHLREGLSCQESTTVADYLFPSRHVVIVYIRDNCISYLPYLAVGGNVIDIGTHIWLLRFT